MKLQGRWTPTLALLTLGSSLLARTASPGPTAAPALEQGQTASQPQDDGGAAPADLRAVTAQLEAERRAWNLRETELRARETELRARETELRARIDALESELAEEQQLRLTREREWLEFTRVLTSFELPLPPAPEFIQSALTGPPDPVAEEAARQRTRALARGVEMRGQLRALLTAEQILSLDFMELGAPELHAGRGVTGPVVARLMDDRGRLIGSLAAARLSLEVSRAARSVTLVLEDGYESRGGQREPFSEGLGGARRIFLGSVDPEPWLEALPELIAPEDERQRADDGRWDLSALRVRLNELLRSADLTGGSGWRIRALGGVVGAELTDLQLVEYGDDGAVQRRLFADRMRIERVGRNVELVLTDGSQERLGRMAPFLEGRFRVALPRSDADAWRAAGVPGLGAKTGASGTR
ncbi:MAG: hypothetical protein R3F49_19200 [Planctomycetota bacterium]